MRPERHESIAKSLIPAGLAGLDGILTVFGQADTYLAGDHSTVQEGNPIGAFFLSLSPSIFLIAIGVWMLTIIALAVFLPPKLGDVISPLISIGHAVGASTWLIQLPLGFLWVFSFWLFIRVLVFPFYVKLLSRNRPLPQHEN